MPCFHPLTAWRSSSGRMVFDPNNKDIISPEEVPLPCGQCIGCRLKRSRDWAIRCMHEASLHQQNCYITLTYNDANLPKYGNLVKSDFQKFMKRLRKRFPGRKIRYFMSGEYGDKRLRPHFHAIIFGLDFDDKKYFKTRGKYKLYRSETLEKLWKFGYSSVGSVTFESAGYVARYIIKKQLSRRKYKNGEYIAKYCRIDNLTGEVIELTPEYCNMSLKPAIASGWFEKYSGDVYPKDSISVNGRLFKPPAYYDRILSQKKPEIYFQIKTERYYNAIDAIEDNTPERLSVKKIVQLAALDKLPRVLK